MGIGTVAIIENRLSGDELGRVVEQLNANCQLEALMREYDAHLRAELPQLQRSLVKPWVPESVLFPESINIRDESDPEAAYIEPWEPSHLISLWGPFGHLRVYESLAEVGWFWCRWSVFLTESRFRIPLVEATRVISTILNAGTASIGILLPDSSFPESAVLDQVHRTMPELLAWLREHCGAPAEPIESSRVDRNAGGYYVVQWPEAGIGQTVR
jgi:hypothetical protein